MTQTNHSSFLETGLLHSLLVWISWICPIHTESAHRIPGQKKGIWLVSLESSVQVIITITQFPPTCQGWEIEERLHSGEGWRNEQRQFTSPPGRSQGGAGAAGTHASSDSTHSAPKLPRLAEKHTPQEPKIVLFTFIHSFIHLLRGTENSSCIFASCPQ